jgi:hypothetical protein
MMTGKPSYRLASQRLDVPRLSLVIIELYSKTEIVRALRRGGFQVAGTRLAKLSMAKLVDWMADAFFRRPDFGARIAVRLDERTSQLKSELAASKPSGFAKTIFSDEGALTDNRLPRVIWALATDPRPQSERTLRRLLTRVNRASKDALELMQNFEEDLDELADWDEEQDRLLASSSFDMDFVEAKRRAERAEKRVSRQEKKLEALRDKRNDQARKIASLESEKACLRREKVDLERERESLYRKLKKLQNSRPALEQAEKRTRGMRRSLSRLEHELAEARRAEKTWRLAVASLEEASGELSRRVNELEEAQATTEKECNNYKAINIGLREEVARLRSRLAKERDRRAKAGRARSYREQRLGARNAPQLSVETSHPRDRFSSSGG